MASYYEKSGPVNTTKSVREVAGDHGTTDEQSPEHVFESRYDARNMWRMGKTQELKRNYRAFTMIAYTFVLQATWECLIWSYVWTLFGFTPIVVSLAEMASMAPTAGGQYHWASEFAPPKYQKLISYFMGWQAALGWQAGSASGSFLAGTIVQGLIVIANPDYDPQGWQGTLLVFAWTLILFIFNVYLTDGMPLIQTGLLVFHICMFVAVVASLWAVAPLNSAETVFATFYNGGGWPTMGVALMVGQISAIYSSLGTDAAAHMSEETKDAGVAVPKAMLWSYLGNFALGIITLITFCFALRDVEAALDDDTGYPMLYVFRTTFSDAGTYCLSAGIIILLVASNISYNASTARQTWAFARDGGLIGNRWLAKVDPKRHIPANAVIFSCAFTCVLSLINIGSTDAFNAIISLNTVALMGTYAVSIGCVLYRRLFHPELLPSSARWTLGRWGVPVNAVGLAYALFGFFWCFWPNEYEPDVAGFNWSVVIFAAVFALSVAVYAVRGHKTYTPPVLLVKSQAPVTDATTTTDDGEER